VRLGKLFKYLENKRAILGISKIGLDASKIWFWFGKGLRKLVMNLLDRGQ
jgi:hypothetical protein